MRSLFPFFCLETWKPVESLGCLFEITIGFDIVFWLKPIPYYREEGSAHHLQSTFCSLSLFLSLFFMNQLNVKGGAQNNLSP